MVFQQPTAERLRGIDANFLYAETETTLMHTLKVGVFDAPAPGVDVFEALKGAIEVQLRHLPGLRRRVHFVPLQLGHPVWVDVPVDVQRHVYRRTIDAPGRPREMDAAIAEIASRRLPRDRPLWEVWLLDGRADGQIVVVVKLHHAVADGVASAAILNRIAGPPPVTPLHPDERTGHVRHSRRRLIADALIEKPERLRRLAGLVRDSMGRMTGAAGNAPRAFQAPRTVFNGALPKTRAFATTRLPLDEVKRAHRRAGVTLNDLYLSLVATSVRRYLERIGEPAGQPLLASVPVSVQLDGGDGRLSGNHLSNLITRLPMHLNDPLRHVYATAEEARVSKGHHRQKGERALTDWAEFTPGALFAGAMNAYSRFRIADQHRPPVNLVVSNVRGPANLLSLHGAVLREIYSVGPVLHGIGLNVTAWSYAGSLQVCAQARGDLPLDLHEVTTGLHDALHDVKRALPSAPDPAPRRRLSLVR